VKIFDNDNSSVCMKSPFGDVKDSRGSDVSGIVSRRWNPV